MDLWTYVQWGYSGGAMGAYKLGAYFLIFEILRLLKTKSYCESMKVDSRGWIFIKQNQTQRSGVKGIDD